MKKLVFASSNPGKIAEMRAIMPKGIELLGLSDIGFTEEIEENGKSFEENAAIKANTVFEACSIMCFADDSGLEVKALNGAPGIKSARYAGFPSDTEKNKALLLNNLQGKSDRSAKFTTVICLKSHNKTFFFEGNIEGSIALEERGINGFGYDPLFIPEAYDISFAEMDTAEKNRISHRRMALDKMLVFLEYM